jgi:uncharacterized protein (TIGR02646 family)
MRTIRHTATPPACLRKQPPNQSWDDFSRTPCHREVGTSLRIEQHHVCCYCELELRDGGSHIEHMEPRKAKPSRTYEYDNLAASCNGGTVEHCGHFKDDRRNRDFCYDPTLFSSPHDEATTRLFRYRLDGSIDLADGLDTASMAKATYMIRYLGLECVRLTYRREKHWRDVAEALGDGSDTETLQCLKDYYLTPGDGDRLQQFYSVSKTVLDP